MTFTVFESAGLRYEDREVFADKYIRTGTMLLLRGDILVKVISIGDSADELNFDRVKMNPIDIEKIADDCRKRDGKKTISELEERIKELENVIDMCTDLAEKALASLESSVKDQQKTEKVGSELVLDIDEVPTFQFTYVNWQDVVEERSVRPIKLWYGYSEYHTGPQWFMRAMCLERNAIRDFTLAGIRGTL